MLFRCLTLEFSGLSVYKDCLQDSLTVKAIKASVNVSNVEYKSYPLLWYTEKKHLHEISVYLQKKTPTLLPRSVHR